MIRTRWRHQQRIQERMGEALDTAHARIQELEADVVRRRSMEDDVHEAALRAIQAAWRSGYLACAHDRDEGETGLGDSPEAGCDSPECYLQEAQAEPSDLAMTNEELAELLEADDK